MWGAIKHAARARAHEWTRARLKRIVIDIERKSRRGVHGRAGRPQRTSKTEQQIIGPADIKARAGRPPSNRRVCVGRDTTKHAGGDRNAAAASGTDGHAGALSLWSLRTRRFPGWTLVSTALSRLSFPPVARDSITKRHPLLFLSRALFPLSGARWIHLREQLVSLCLFGQTGCWFFFSGVGYGHVVRIMT